MINEIISRTLEEIIETVRDPRSKEMLVALNSMPEIYKPSKFWNYYLQVHLGHIKKTGIENFKRTINLNYFNWTIHRIPEQSAVLAQQLNAQELQEVAADLNKTPETTAKPTEWTAEQWTEYVQFLLMWHKFARKRDDFNLLKTAHEPLSGNPLAAKVEGNWTSQDLCNSTHEATSVLSGLKAQGKFDNLQKQRLHIAELGAGYGRFDFVWLKRFPNHKVTIIDIPPALRLSEWYLPRVLPDAKVFAFRDFDKFEEIEEEYTASDIAFFLPHQIEKLPGDIFDLFINISSLHEMTHEQIRLWMDHIDRTCSGHFYTKQWYESVNNHDNIKITQSDYPIALHWKEIFNRPCDIQPKFFEAFYSTRRF